MYLLRKIFGKPYRTLKNHIFNSYLVWFAWKESMEREALKGALKECGQGVNIRGPIFSSGLDRISFGDNVHIGQNAIIMGLGGLSVGDNTHISHNVVIYTANHNYYGERLPYDDTHIYKPVTIGKNVWIGVNVTIVPGVTIGDGAIVGAGTVVDRDVPPLAIIGSRSYRILKYRDAEHYWALENAKQYGGKNGRALQNKIKME